MNYMKWGILLAAWIIPKFNLVQYVWSVALISGGTLTEGGFLLFGLGRWMKIVGTASGLNFNIPTTFVALNWSFSSVYL